MFSPPLRGPPGNEARQSADPRRDGLRCRHDRLGAKAVPHPKGHGSGEGAGRGRHWRAGRHLFQPAMAEKSASCGGNLHFLRQSRGIAPAKKHGRPHCGAGRPAGTHRPHRAGVSSDRRGQPAAAVTGHPAGAGRLRRHSAGLPAGRRAAGPPALPGELRLREHPLSGIPGGAGHCPAASGF